MGNMGPHESRSGRLWREQPRLSEIRLFDVFGHLDSWPARDHLWDGYCRCALGHLAALLGGGRSLVTLNPSWWDKASAFDAELTILHELGHLFLLGSSFGSGGSKILPDPVPGANGRNDDLVINNCITAKPGKP